MFIVAESVEGGIWRGLAGIFTAEVEARRFIESLDEQWRGLRVHPVPWPDAYPFFLTGEGVELSHVRPVADPDLERLLDAVPTDPEDDGTILWNVYSVHGDCFNRAFPGEPVLPKLDHYHVTPAQHDFRTVCSHLR